MSKLPGDMILSPDVLQVSSILGQGETSVPSLSVVLSPTMCLNNVGEFGVVYKGYLKSDMTDAVAIKTIKGNEHDSHICSTSKLFYACPIFKLLKCELQSKHRMSSCPGDIMSLAIVSQ